MRAGPLKTPPCWRASPRRSPGSWWPTRRISLRGPSPQPVDVQLSALEGTGEADLVQALLERCGAAGTEGVLLALNQRQRDLAAQAAEALARSQEVAAQQLPWDFWTIDLRDAIRALGEITGEELTEAVLDRVFSRFCIGK